MDEAQKARVKMDCIIEASKLKQSPIAAKEYVHKNIVDLAKEIKEFVLGKNA